MAVPLLNLDSNVVVSSLRSTLGASHRLVQNIGRGVFDLALTTPLALEYEDACMRLVGWQGLTPLDIQQLIDFLYQSSCYSEVHFLLRPTLSDPKDEMVLEAAVASGSDWIVTFNAHDFAGVPTQYGIELIKPGEALRRLGLVP